MSSASRTRQSTATTRSTTRAAAAAAPPDIIDPASGHLTRSTTGSQPGPAQAKKTAAEKEAERKAKAMEQLVCRQKAAAEKARHDNERGPDTEDNALAPEPAVAPAVFEEEEDDEDDELAALQHSIGHSGTMSPDDEIASILGDDDDDQAPASSPPATSDIEEYEDEPAVVETIVPSTPKKRKAGRQHLEVDKDIHTPPRKKNGKIVMSQFSPNGADANLLGKAYTAADIVTVNAYPSTVDRNTFYLASLKEAVFGPFGSEGMQRSYHKFVDQSNYGKLAVGMQEYAGQAVKSKFCTAARALVAAWLPVVDPDEKVAQSLTMDRVAKCKGTSCHLYSGLDWETMDWNKMGLTQGRMFVDLVHSYMFINRGTHDVEGYRRLVEYQRVVNPTLALCGAAFTHCIDEWIDGYFVKKPFTVAASVEYNRILTKLNSWEAKYPHWVHQWQTQMFKDVCNKANKSWIYTQVIVDDDEETTAALMEAEAEAAAAQARRA